MKKPIMMTTQNNNFHNMTSKEFFYLVCSMRAAQKSYFKNRANDTLRACRALENDVDREIARVKQLTEGGGI